MEHMVARSVHVVCLEPLAMQPCSAGANRISFRGTAKGSVDHPPNPTGFQNQLEMGVGSPPPFIGDGHTS